MSNTETLRAALRAAREARDAIPLGAERSVLNVALDRLDVALSAAVALAQPAASGEPLSGKWEGAEEWMPLAWELCADECGEEACTELVWEGGPVPEPWGDRWLKYEDEAKRLIALVRKHAPAAQPAPALRWCNDCGEGVVHFCRASRADCPAGGSVAPQPAPARVPLTDAQIRQIAGKQERLPWGIGSRWEDALAFARAMLAAAGTPAKEAP